jgi:hypothetical protein
VKALLKGRPSRMAVESDAAERFGVGLHSLPSYLQLTLAVRIIPTSRNPDVALEPSPTSSASATSAKDKFSSF